MLMAYHLYASAEDSVTTLLSLHPALKVQHVSLVWQIAVHFHSGSLLS